jgi:hypothetical protein
MHCHNQTSLIVHSRFATLQCTLQKPAMGSCILFLLHSFCYRKNHSETSFTKQWFLQTSSDTWAFLELKQLHIRVVSNGGSLGKISSDT